MNCKKIRKKLPYYLTDELNQQDKETISEHLKLCLNCQKQLGILEQIELTIQNLRDNSEEKELPSGFKETLLSNIDANMNKEHSLTLFGWNRPLERLVTVAILLIVGVLISLFFSTFREIIAFKKSENWEIAYKLAQYRIKEIEKKDFMSIPIGVDSPQKIIIGDKSFHQIVKVKKKNANTKWIDVEVSWKENKTNMLVKISRTSIKKETLVPSNLYQRLRKILKNQKTK